MNNIVEMDDDTLKCPECNEIYLHQTSVEVIFRDNEDGDGTRTRVNEKNTNIDRVLSETIPGRRDAIQINFLCENCDSDKKELSEKEVKKLQIIQHKGLTVFEWIHNKDADEEI